MFGDDVLLNKVNNLFFTVFERAVIIPSFVDTIRREEKVGGSCWRA